MGRTRLEVVAHPRGGRPRVVVRSDGPAGRGHLGVRVLAAAARGVRVALVAEGALLVAGDDICLEVRVGPGVRLEIVEPAGTVAYAMRGGSASWRVDVAIAEGAHLDWWAEPFVVAARAHVDRSLSVALAPDATAVLRDTVVLGRAGEAGGVMRQRTRVTHDDRPLLAEDLSLDGGQRRVGVVGTHRVLDTLAVLGRRAPEGGTTLGGGRGTAESTEPTPSGQSDAAAATRPERGRRGMAALTRLELDGEGTVLRAVADELHLSPVARLRSHLTGRTTDPATFRASYPGVRVAGTTTTPG